MFSHLDVPLREKNIMLIGFMGVGKTSIGHHLARMLYRDFIDVDQVIEQQHGMPVTQIFKAMGETQFRAMEKEFILGLCRDTRLKIVSLGGGAFLQEEIRQACLSTSIVLFLDLGWESWKERLHLIVDSRPVLQDKSLEEIEQLFLSRQRIYEVNHSSVNTEQLNAEDAAGYIIETLKYGWDMYDPPRAPFLTE